MAGPADAAKRSPQKRPSAALILGVLSGCVAAVAVLPTAIPLTRQLVEAEETIAVRHASQAASIAASLVEDHGSLPPGTQQRLGVAYLRVVSGSGLLLHQDGPELDAAFVDAACAAPSREAVVGDGTRSWALACVDADGAQVVAALRPVDTSRTQMVFLVLTLAVIVGIVTALGVLRLLYPVSQLSRAIVRVGAGEHGVRVPSTGFSELDELVERLNFAAQAMEDREDAIVARIKVVQGMARMVAHEVRNPLQSLELLTSLIASENNPEERHELAKAIHNEIRALDMVVTRVLREGASRGAVHLPLHRTRQSLLPIVDQVLALRLPEAKAHGIVLERGEMAACEPVIDAALLGRSVENLVLNAMQAVPRQGGRIRVSVQADATETRICVEDNGPGVDPALAEHVFEPNVTGRTGGTGLGLALVKEVVEAHGGYIAHDRSPLLGGARFTARIPMEVPRGGEKPEGPDRR